MIQVKPGLMFSAKKPIKMVYRSKIEDDRMVYVLKIGNKKAYVGDHIENIGLLFDLFGSFTTYPKKNSKKKRRADTCRLFIHNFLKYEVKTKMK